VLTYLLTYRTSRDKNDHLLLLLRSCSGNANFHYQLVSSLFGLHCMCIFFLLSCFTVTFIIVYGMSMALPFACYVQINKGTDADVAATSGGRSSTARRRRLSGSRSSGTSRQPSEDDRDEPTGAASTTGDHHTGRRSRRTDSGGTGKQLLSPDSVDDDEPEQISPLQVDNKTVITVITPYHVI